MIPHGRATAQPAKPDSPVPRQVIGCYRRTGFARWYPAVFAALWLILGISQYLQRGQWGDLAMAAAWTALAIAASWPQTVISDRGVRFLGRRIIPWSEVVDVVAHPNNRWTQRPPELVLRDGRRKPLPELKDSHLEGLRSLARQHGAPIPG